MERAVAEIDLAALRGNIATLRALAPASAFMAVVKAEGYGHGMLPAGRAAREAGAEFLGVALPTEAHDLREDGDTGRVMCWLYPPTVDLTECVARDVDLSAASPGQLDQITAAADRAGRTARVHLKVDSGLGRNGAMPDQWRDLVAAGLACQQRGVLAVVGVWSHLASADEPAAGVTESQVAVFDDALAQARDAGLDPELVHLASSAGVLAHPATHHNLVRCGISVYGLSPGPELGTSAELGLTPVMTVTARVALVKGVPAGHGVSYGHRYRTTAATRLALIPVGYADGLPRAGSGRLPITVNGVTFPVAGTIAMDQVVLDVGDHPVEAGDEVVLFGTGRDDTPTADDWAAACGTINYEIVTRLGFRIPRRYTGT